MASLNAENPADALAKIPESGAPALAHPRSGTLEEWNEAYLRLEDYLRAHQLGDRWHQHDLMGGILWRAAGEHARDPERPVTTVVIETAYDLIENWFQQTLSVTELSPDRRSAAGRVALYLIDGANRWPSAFLAPQVPREFVEAMHQTTITAGPDLQISRMIAREMDFGAMQTFAQEDTSWRKTLQAFLLWFAIFVVAYGLYWKFA